MSNISQEIGRNISLYRKKRGLSLQQLADAIYKSRATVSKYENGGIVIDIETLYQIARQLQVPVDHLLYKEPAPPLSEKYQFIPTFFQNLNRLYMYSFDGRRNRVGRGIFDILDQSEPRVYRVMFYLCFEDYDCYQICENSYSGYVKFFDILAQFDLYNQDSPIEHTMINIPTSFRDSDTLWGMFCSLSSRPFMPLSSRVLFSKKRLPENEELIKKLRISKEDVRLLKTYNGFAVMGGKL